jgi:hypothetical protein
MNNIFLYLVICRDGKLTIARAFARHVGAKVVDNQWINNPIFGLIDPDGVTCLPNGLGQTAKVREAVSNNRDVAKPGTNRITHDGIEGEPMTKACCEASNPHARRGAQLIPVRLVCDEDELKRRIQSPDRAPMLSCVDPPMRSTKVATTSYSIQVAGDFDARRDEVDTRAKRRGNCRTH